MGETVTSALKKAINDRHEAEADRLGKKFAKKMGPIRLFGGESPLLKVVNEELDRQRRRKLN